MIRVGLFLYDHLGGRMTLPKSFGVKLAGSRWGAGLQPRFARGFVYADARVDDARLVVLNALDAQARGAEIRVRTRVIGARREGGMWRATLQGRKGAMADVSARAIVNAGGPWVKQVLDSVSAAPTREGVRHVKGSHIVVPRVHPEEHAYLLQNADKRIVFVIPYQEHFSLIGTTDIPVDEYDHPAITESEIDYLLALVNSYLERPLTRADIVWSYSGVRPLHDDGSTDPAAVTRDYVFKVDALEGEAGPDRAPVLSIFGGKITTYRKLAEAVLGLLAPYLPAMKPAWTRDAPLPGGDFPERDRNAFFAGLCRTVSESFCGFSAWNCPSAWHARVADSGRRIDDGRTGTGFRRRTYRARDRLPDRRGVGTKRGRRAVATDQMRPADDASAARCRGGVLQRCDFARGFGMSASIASICLFCGSNVGTRPAYADAATQFGRTIASRGVTLIYGGGSVGLMDIAAQAALDAGGRVIGVITEQLMVREVGHSGFEPTPCRGDDARAQSVDGKALGCIHRTSWRVRYIRRVVRNGHLGSARHPCKTAGRRQS